MKTVLAPPRTTWQPPPLTVGEVKDLIAGLLAAPMPQPAKAATKPKLLQALYGGGRFKILSVDIEALPLGDSDCNPDSVVLVIGLQSITIECWHIQYGKPKQEWVREGFDSVDLANWAHEQSAGFDALLMYYAKYDHDILQSYEPFISESYGRFTPLPPVCIDIMGPFSRQGISASQAHLSAHYGIGVEKQSVNIEIWRRVVAGRFFGFTEAETMRECRRIRDERNARCLIDNIADIVFIAKNIRYQNRFRMLATYPNESKIKELLGES